jgi:hypothetical protein
MGTRVFRLNEFVLLELNDANDDVDFYKVMNEVDGNVPQFEPVSSDFNKIIWDNGVYKHRLNKVYTNAGLYVPGQLTGRVNSVEYSNARFLLKQGFSFDDVFGLHFIIKDVTSNTVLTSCLRQVLDFSVPATPYFNGADQFTAETTIMIPLSSNVLVAQVTTVTNDDISDSGSNIGLVYNYPYEFVPLIEDKPVPDFIVSSLSLDDNHYIRVQVSTTENKTVEQSVLDYFGLEIADINVTHVIDYGNEELGYKSLRVSNEDNRYLPVNVGLNLLEFGNSMITITSTTEIEVDGKLMKRQATLNTDLSVINPYLVSLITHPDTLYPVEVNNSTIVQNTIIETREQREIIKVLQPVFAEMINDSFKFERKNIYFDRLTSASYLRIIKDDKNDEQLIASQITVDNRYYFDLSQATPVVANGSYQLLDMNTLKVFGSGTFTV